MIDDLEADLFGENKDEYTMPTFDVDFADQGKAGYEMVKASLYDDKRYSVAFVDMRMPPGWDGLETVQKIWEIDTDIEVIFCTAFSDYTIAEMRQAFGENSNFLMIRKPFSSTEVIQAAHACCEKWSLRQKAKQDLKKMRTQLQHADKMVSIGQLAAGVAHEINSPINFVKTNTKTLSEYFSQFIDFIDQIDVKPDDYSFIKEDSAQLVEESLDGIKRVVDIVDNLKNFSRVGDMDWSECDVHDGIESTLKIVHNEIKYKADLVKNFGNIPKITAVASQLNQVFMNMLVNASHAIDEKGEITITTSQPTSDHIMISFSDTGSGIEKSKIDQIFDPFFTTKPVGKGTGLGLSLSYNIINKHGGKIEVESEVGKGTTFNITLPIKRKQERVA